MAKLTSLTPEEKAQLAQLVGVNGEVDQWWMKIAEFGEYYGWAAIKDVLDPNSGLDIDTMEVLIASSRKIHAAYMVDMAQAVLAANAAVNSKDKGTFRKFIKVFTDKMKVKA